MKKSHYVGGISMVIIGIAGVNSSFASNENAQSLPPEYSILTSTELATLSSLTGAELDEFLQNKGITHPVMIGTGGEYEGRGDISQLLNLTEAEKIALESMTQTERDAFFTSKGFTRPTRNNETYGHSGSTTRSPGIKNNNKKNQLQNLNTTINSTTTSEITQTRAEHIAQNNAKTLATKKTKIQKKVSANEALTRLEKKFADANGIEY